MDVGIRFPLKAFLGLAPPYFRSSSLSSNVDFFNVPNLIPSIKYMKRSTFESIKFVISNRPCHGFGSHLDEYASA